jgi:hypothetical protein
LLRSEVELPRIPSRKPTPSAKPRPARKRANTAVRAEQALEDTSNKPPPPPTDDPSRDKTAIDEDGVMEPLKHAD